MAVICLKTHMILFITFTQKILFQLRSCVCMWILVSLVVTKVNILKRAVRAQCPSCSINILFGVTPVMLWRKCLCHNFDATPVPFFFTNRFLCVTVPTYLYFQGKSSHVSSSPSYVMEVLDPTLLQINIQKLQLLCLSNLSKLYEKGVNNF